MAIVLIICILILWIIQIIAARLIHGMPVLFRSDIDNMLFASEVILGIIVGCIFVIGIINKFFIHC